MQKTLALLAVLLASCAVMDHERVEGWPELQIVEHYVPNPEMRDRCARYVGFGMSPVACAEFNLVYRRCDIWFSSDFPPQRFIKEHERLHCAGYDHVGADNMRKVLERYVAAGSPVAPGLSTAAAGSSQ